MPVEVTSDGDNGHSGDGSSNADDDNGANRDDSRHHNKDSIRSGDDGGGDRLRPISEPSQCLRPIPNPIHGELPRALARLH